MNSLKSATGTNRVVGQASQDYATIPVSREASVGAWRIGLIIMGAMIALPSFMMGAELAHSLGALGSAQACLVGGIILMLVAIPAAYAGARSKLSTYMLISEAFGSTGGHWVNGLLSFSLLGWFGVIAMMFGGAMAAVAPNTIGGLSATTWAIGGCLLMIASNFIGFKALDTLSWITTPLKIMLLGLSCWVAYRQFGLDFLQTPVTPAYSIREGVSIVVGGIAVGSLLTPDISRYARSPRHAMLACLLAFGLGFPLILMLAGFPSLATNQHDLVPIMLTLGLGLPAMLVILLAAWSTNTYNLYASTLVWASITPRVPRWQLALLAGLVGSASGLAGISEQLTQYLILLSILVPPIGGVYLCNYYLSIKQPTMVEKKWRVEAFIGWSCGVAAAALQGLWPFTLTTVHALDSLLVAAVTYLIVRRLLVRSAS